MLWSLKVDMWCCSDTRVISRPVYTSVFKPPNDPFCNSILTSLSLTLCYVLLDDVVGYERYFPESSDLWILLCNLTSAHFVLLRWSIRLGYVKP